MELPREERIRWTLEKSARLLAGGAEPVSGLVLPTGEFFPDTFDRSEKAIRKLLRRIVKLAGLSDIDIRLTLVRPDEDELSGGGCSSGACGIGGGKAPEKIQRVVEQGDGYRVNILASEVGNSTVLTTAMVRAVSHIFMLEADLYTHFSRPEAEAGVDLTGVMLGFGALLANGAHIYSKG